MGSADSEKKNNKTKREKKSSYLAPKIIYEGRIAIRAGTPESAIPGVPSSDSLPFGDTQN